MHWRDPSRRYWSDLILGVLLELVPLILVVCALIAWAWQAAAPWDKPAAIKPEPIYMDSPRGKGPRPGVSHVPHQATDPARRAVRVGTV